MADQTPHYVVVTDTNLMIVTGRDAAEWSSHASRQNWHAVYRVDAAETADLAVAAVMRHLHGRWLGTAIVVREYPRPETADEKLDAARNILRADYWQDVHNVVDDLRRNIESGHVTDREDAERFLDESCDGRQRVIYTGQAIECLLFSRHEDEFYEQLNEAPNFADGMQWSQLAYYAFRADVDDEVGDLDDFITEHTPKLGDCFDCGEAVASDDDNYAPADGDVAILCADCAADRADAATTDDAE